MIPLCVPNINGNEWEYVRECLDTGWVSSAGGFVSKFEDEIKKYTGSQYAIACVNGTSALQVSLRLVGVEQGDEVIVPTLTFIAPVNSIIYNNATPIFMDVDKYYNIDVSKTISFLKNETVFQNGFTYNKKTKNCIRAIIPVHMYGNAVDLGELINLCSSMNIKVVEDASESLGTFLKRDKDDPSHTGTFGEIGCLSFNGNKMITTGGGGMILTNDNQLAEKAKYLTTQAKDDPVRYIHNDIGYNFRLTNIQAAVGLAQFQQLDYFLSRKKYIYEFYKKFCSRTEGLEIASCPTYSINNNWMSILQIDNDIYGKDREDVMMHLSNKKIQTRPVWALIHQQKPYIDAQRYKISLAYELVEKSLCLPSSTDIKKTDLEKIINELGN